MISNRSIAYGIAQACHREGAELAFTYVVDKLEDRVREMAADFGSKLVFRCDVQSDEEINKLFTDLGRNGTAWTAWCTPSPSPRANRWKAISWTR